MVLRACCFFCVLAALLAVSPAVAMPTISIKAPGVGAVDDVVDVVANVTSPYVITSVNAKIGNVSRSLSYALVVDSSTLVFRLRQNFGASVGAGGIGLATIAASSGSDASNEAQAVVSVLSDAFHGVERPYVASGGWVAFERGGPQNDPKAAWTRSPGGGTIALASPVSNVRMAAVNGVGEVAYDAELPTTPGRKRWLGSAGSSGGAPTRPVLASSAQGAMRYLDGEWYTFIGRELFRIDRNAIPPSTDASAADANTEGVDGAAELNGEGSSSSPFRAGGGGCAVSTSSELASLLGVVTSSILVGTTYRRRRRPK